MHKDRFKTELREINCIKGVKTYNLAAKRQVVLRRAGAVTGFDEVARPAGGEN